MNDRTTSPNHVRSRELTVLFGSSKQWTHRNNPADFAREVLGFEPATVAHDDGASSRIAVKRGELAFERRVASDPRAAFSWAIHPETFEAPELLELGRLQAWTLKPARLR